MHFTQYTLNTQSNTLKTNNRNTKFNTLKTDSTYNTPYSNTVNVKIPDSAIQYMLLVMQVACVVPYGMICTSIAESVRTLMDFQTALPLTIAVEEAF